MYARKVFYVMRYHKTDPETYRKRAYPAVLHSKIWNLIQGITHFMACTVFITQGGRVCAGWYLPSQRYEQFMIN